MIRIKGRRDWIRHRPLATKIAGELVKFDGLLGLRSRRLVPDVAERYGVSTSTAAHAVAAARKIEMVCQLGRSLNA